MARISGLLALTASLAVVSICGVISAQTLDRVIPQQIYQQKGEEGLRPYIQVAADSVLTILSSLEIEGTYLGEGRGERLGDYLDILSYAGDMSTKNALLKAMISPYVGGNSIARGLMRLGPAVTPEIIAYLERDNGDYRTGTMSTLRRMARLDSTGTYFTRESRAEIRDSLVAMLTDRADLEAVRGAIGTLAYFGDESVIPLLEELSREEIPGLQPAIRSPNIPFLPNTPLEVIEYLREKDGM